MPRLHKYHQKDACYVLTSIGGSVVTFQLTAEGERKLADAGVVPGDKFPRGLLLDLYRTGDAYTGGSGLEPSSASAENQLEIDFENDPDSETAFPACDICGSIVDLHLILRGDKNGLAAKLECATCRAKPSVQLLDTSVPVALMSRSLFSRLCQLKPVAIKGKNVTRLEELLNVQFESKWENLRTGRKAEQTSLFEASDTRTLDLS